MQAPVQSPLPPQGLPSPQGLPAPQGLPSPNELAGETVQLDDTAQMVEGEEEQQNPSPSAFRNIAEDMDADLLKKIGQDCKDGFDRDIQSLSDLDEERAKISDLFDLIAKKKNYPWPDASNVKLPMITTACINFQARAFPNLFPSPNNVVKCLGYGNDPANYDRGLRVQNHMNFQICNEMEEFFEGFGNSLMGLSKDGYAFRKTYFDPVLGRNVAEDVLPEDFVVNYYCRDLNKSYRYTHILYFTVDELQKRQEEGLFINTEDLPIPSYVDYKSQAKEKNDANNKQQQPVPDYATPRMVLEQHTYLELKAGKDEMNKEKGSRVPCVVTLDYETGNVLRITERLHPTKKKKIINYFVTYTFIPNPKSIYGYGFGKLLLAINEAANTNINQLTDAAHLQNTKGGFVLKGSGVKRGDLSYSMGEFKEINLRSDDISKALMPMKFDPPSTVLLSLVEFLYAQVDKLTTVTELFTGQAPRSDTTATSTATAVEQGAKLFTAIQQRIHLSLKKELKNLFTLNSIYLNEPKIIKTAALFKGDSAIFNISPEDYAEDLKIVPISDPNIISSQQKVGKAQFLSQMVAQNPYLAQDPEVLAFILKRNLEAVEEDQLAVEFFGNKMKQVILQIQQQNQQGQLQQEQDKLSQMNGMPPQGQPQGQPQGRPQPQGAAPAR